MEFRQEWLHCKSKQKLAQGFAIICFVMAVCFGNGSAAIAQQVRTVDLELVLAIDCSSSVDAYEYDLQMQGVAQAFLHPDVLAAVARAGKMGVAISLVQWSGRQQQVKAVDWHLVTDKKSAILLSRQISATDRQVRGSTSTGGAIDFSTAEIHGNGYEGRRKVIDVSGDGTGRPVLSKIASERAVATGITVNGLVIFNREYDLGELANINVGRFYAESVIGGAGAFLMAANSFKDFQVAIRKKLVREISGLAVSELPIGKRHAELQKAQ